MSLIQFPADLRDADAEPGAPAPDRIVDGDPAFRTWVMSEASDGKLFAGVWEATPGAWRVVYDEWEYCAILSGLSILERDGAPPVRLAAGDHIVIEPGFTGVWRMLETTRKTFVVRLP